MNDGMQKTKVGPQKLRAASGTQWDPVKWKRSQGALNTEWQLERGGSKVEFPWQQGRVSLNVTSKNAPNKKLLDPHKIRAQMGPEGV